MKRKTASRVVAAHKDGKPRQKKLQAKKKEVKCKAQNTVAQKDGKFRKSAKLVKVDGREVKLFQGSRPFKGVPGGFPVFVKSVRGRKPKQEIDWERVFRLAWTHCTPEEISWILGIPLNTLKSRREFPVIFQKAWESGKASLRRMQWAVARRGNVTMLIWLGKQILKQRDHVTSELVGPGGGPIQVQSQVDYSKLSVEELLQLRELVAKATIEAEYEVLPGEEG